MRGVQAFGYTWNADDANIWVYMRGLRASGSMNTVRKEVSSATCAWNTDFRVCVECKRCNHPGMCVCVRERETERERERVRVCLYMCVCLFHYVFVCDMRVRMSTCLSVYVCVSGSLIVFCGDMCVISLSLSLPPLSHAQSDKETDI